MDPRRKPSNGQSLHQRRFDAGWPALGGTFARRVVHGGSYADDLIDGFSGPRQAPRSAISPDMLDTGTDVPQAVNRVFLEAVRPKPKFRQMVARGARPCPNQSGRGRHETAFRVVNMCRNLEVFGQNRQFADPPMALSLTERVIGERVAIVRGTEERPDAGGVDGGLSLSEARSQPIGEIRRFVATLDLSSFVFRGGPGRAGAGTVVGLQAGEALRSRDVRSRVLPSAPLDDVNRHEIEDRDGG